MKVEMIDIEKIKPYSNNPKKHPEKQINDIASSIKHYGFSVPIIIDGSNVIVAGHGRYKAARKLGLKEVPCIKRTDLTEAQAKAFRIADNKVAESPWDMELLNIEMEDLDLFTGFDDIEVEDVEFEIEKSERVYLRTLSHNLGAYHIHYLSEIDKDEIMRWKDNDAGQLTSIIVDDFIKVLKKRPGYFDCVTVPPPSKKRGSYENYPIADVGREIADKLDKPFEEVFEVKKGKTRRSKHGRLETAQEMFEIKNLTYKSYLVVDDVSTTGKTFETVQRTLAAEKITCFMIAWCFWGH